MRIATAARRALAAVWGAAWLAGCGARELRVEDLALPPGLPVLRVQAFDEGGGVRVDGHILGVPASARVAVDREGHVLVAVSARGTGGGYLRKFSPALDPVWSA